VVSDAVFHCLTTTGGASPSIPPARDKFGLFPAPPRPFPLPRPLPDTFRTPTASPSPPKKTVFRTTPTPSLSFSSAGCPSFVSPAIGDRSSPFIGDVSGRKGEGEEGLEEAGDDVDAVCGSGCVLAEGV